MAGISSNYLVFIIFSNSIKSDIISLVSSAIVLSASDKKLAPVLTD